MGIQINLVTMEISIEMSQNNEIKIALPYIAIPILDISGTILNMHKYACLLQYYKAKLWI